MASTKIEVEHFIRTTDFSLQRLKMRALLIQQRVVEAVEGEEDLPCPLILKKKRNRLLSRRHKAFILSLGEKALRQVSKEKTAKAVQVKLEQLYMRNSPQNRLFLKQRFYSFRVVEVKPIEEQLHEFSNIVDQLENNDISQDEDKALSLLNAFPKSFEHFSDTIVYGREKTIKWEKFMHS